MMEKSAFLSGLCKGLSAPFALFASQEGPVLTEPFAKIKTSIGDITSDWEKLGGDMNRAMRYGETHPI